MSQRVLYGLLHDGDLTRHNLIQGLVAARAKGQIERVIKIYERLRLHERVRTKVADEPIKRRGGHRRVFRS